MKTLISLLAFASSVESLASNLILRPYQSVRSSGMGGLKLTTGLYDENVFGNPARAIANPSSRFTVFDVMLEANSSGIKNAGDIISADDKLAAAAGTAGQNNHIRLQTTFPSFYKAPAAATEAHPAGKMAWNVGLVTSTQADLALQRTFNADVGAVVDIGLHGTVARKFLENDELAVGINTHLSYRAAAKPGFGLINLIKRDTKILAGGAMVDFDLGGTYQLPIQVFEYSLEAGLVMSNVLGGKHTIAQSGSAGVPPPDQPRSIGFGVSARRPTLWVFTDSVFAFEIQDVGNNNGASIFRTVHFGGEARFGVLAPRIGFNQGYISAGLGVLTRFFTVELATYGEELGLNMGESQDRRFALRLAAQL